MRIASGFASLIGVMDAAEKFQRGSVERLRAETDSIHAGCSHPIKFLKVDCTRIGFEGDFGVT
ncbi:MAG: hypothetical protein ACREQE_03680, partial [Candidatus Binataceae bacterium]